MFEDSLRNVAFALVRSANLVSGALLFGLAVILLLVLRPSLAGSIGAGMERARTLLSHRIASLVTVALITSVTATLVGLLLQSLLIADLRGGDLGTSELEAVLDSSFGFWYALRLPALIGLAVLLGGSVRKRVLAGGGQIPPATAWWAAWILLALGVLLTTSMSGHAVVSSPAALAVMNDGVHLMAGGIWFSGIVVLAGLVPNISRRLEAGDRLKVLAPTVVGFSRLALLSIGAVGVTGIFNAFFNLASVSDLFSSGYGRALSLKLVLFAGILVVGGINHLYVRNRLQRALEEQRQSRASGLFRKTIATELALGIALLVVTGLLVGSARTRQVSSLREPASEQHAAYQAR